MECDISQNLNPIGFKGNFTQCIEHWIIRFNKRPKAVERRSVEISTEIKNEIKLSNIFPKKNWWSCAQEEHKKSIILCFLLFRVWWAIALISSLVLCTIAIWCVWTRWKNHPVIMIFDDKLTSIGTISFPAITICPTQKFRFFQVFKKIRRFLCWFSILLQRRKSEFQQILLGN